MISLCNIKIHCAIYVHVHSSNFMFEHPQHSKINRTLYLNKPFCPRQFGDWRRITAYLLKITGNNKCHTRITFQLIIIMC